MKSETFSCGWFSSGRDQAAIDLFITAWEHMAGGFLPAAIAYVFCDQEPGESAASDRFLDAVQARGVPVVTHSSRQLRRLIRQSGPEAETARVNFDAQVIALLGDFQAQVVVLAGYLLIASPLLCRTYLCLNLHPALPNGPKGTWQEVMWQLMEAGAQETGAMMHLATPELDAGPPVAYFRLPLSGPTFEPLWQEFQQKRQRLSLQKIRAQEGEREPLFARLRQEELRREFPLLLLTLKALAEGRLRLTPSGAEIQGKLIPGGLDLTAQVEEFISGARR